MACLQNNSTAELIEFFQAEKKETKGNQFKNQKIPLGPEKLPKWPFLQDELSNGNQV